LELRQDKPTLQNSAESSLNLITKFFEAKEYSDVTIICSDKVEIAAHRCILAARSSVFEMMLGETSRIVDDDIASEPMQELLRFIYTLEVKNHCSHAAMLIFGAEKYNLPQLKSMCVTSLIESISKENVFDHLVLADCLREQKLSRKCMEFITT
jgi:hypothetical protein